MSTSRAARDREAARQANGRFGTQRRDEGTGITLAPVGVHDDPDSADNDLAHDLAEDVALVQECLSWRETEPLDAAQVDALWRRTVQRQREALAAAETDRHGTADGTADGGGELDLDPYPTWAQRCEKRASALASSDIPQPDKSRFVAGYRALSTRPPADPAVACAILELPQVHRFAARALARQRDAVAVLNDVEPDLAADRIAAFRRHWHRHLADLPDDRRPTPPAVWTDGFTARDYEAKDAPTDPATLYAFYRAQADPDAFSAAERLGRDIASIDLETASPQDKSGFSPSAGHIIEFGGVALDESGTEHDRVSFLVNPGQEALAAYGTGAIDVHHITPDDVRTQPGWTAQAPRAAAFLAGRRILAQNARFETSWLSHHLGLTGRTLNKHEPAIDTYRIALQHFDVPDGYRLARICAHVGVDYTNGHRALHDAEAAARAFVEMRRRITQRWLADPRNAA